MATVLRDTLYIVCFVISLQWNIYKLLLFAPEMVEIKTLFLFFCNLFPILSGNSIYPFDHHVFNAQYCATVAHIITPICNYILLKDIFKISSHIHKIIVLHANASKELEDLPEDRL